MASAATFRHFDQIVFNFRLIMRMKKKDNYLKVISETRFVTFGDFNQNIFMSFR